MQIDTDDVALLDRWHRFRATRRCAFAPLATRFGTRVNHPLAPFNAGTSGLTVAPRPGALEVKGDGYALRQARCGACRAAFLPRGLKGCLPAPCNSVVRRRWLRDRRRVS